MLLHRTLCIFFTAFTRVGTHSCITRIWRTPLHHNKGRAFGFIVQLRQLHVRGETCHAAAALSGSLGSIEYLSPFSEIRLAAEHFSFWKALGDVSTSNLGKNTDNPELDYPQMLDANDGQHQTTSDPLR